MEHILQWDKEFFIYLNHLGNRTFDSFWLFYTNQHNWIFLYLIVIAMYLYFLGWKKTLFSLILIGMGLGICNELTDFIKEYFHRLRPSDNPLLEGKIRELIHPHNGSFISGHASNSTLFVWFSIYLLKKHTKIIYLLILWWLLFMYSRIYVGVHYPSDIFGGIIFGLFILLIIKKIHKKIINKLFT